MSIHNSTLERRTPLKRAAIKRKPPKKKPKKPTRKTLKNRADRLWAQRIKEGGVCQLAGIDEVECKGNLEAAHIIGRRFHSTRFDLQNGRAICQGHHWYYTRRPEAWFILFERLHPGLYAELWRRAQIPWDKDIEAVIAVLSQET